jgi:hypothetical protein
VFATTTDGSLVVHWVEELLVMSWVVVMLGAAGLLKIPMAWNCRVVPGGTVVGAGAGQIVSAGVGVKVTLVLGTGVGGGGGPGQIAMLDRNGPGGAGEPQRPTGMPDWFWTQLLEPPPPQLHHNAPAISIIAAPNRISRAPPTIGNQL